MGAGGVKPARRPISGGWREGTSIAVRRGPPFGAPFSALVASGWWRDWHASILGPLEGSRSARPEDTTCSSAQQESSFRIRTVTFTVSLVSGEFPEPLFSRLQRQVFAEIEALPPPALSSPIPSLPSPRPEGATAVLSKTPDRPKTPGAGARSLVRFGAFRADQLIGWSYGWFEFDGAFYMANSGVAPDARRRGVYSALLAATVDHARSRGAPTVRSRHSVLNNAIIICKLQRGFHVSGFSVTARLGSLVDLMCPLIAEQEAQFRARTVPFAAPEDD